MCASCCLRSSLLLIQHPTSGILPQEEGEFAETKNPTESNVYQSMGRLSSLDRFFNTPTQDCWSLGLIWPEKG